MLISVCDEQKLYQYTKPTGVFVDVGACIGQSIISAIKLEPNLSVIAIEPNPMNIEKLKSAVSKVCSDFKIIDKACYDKKCEVTFEWRKAEADKLYHSGYYGQGHILGSGYKTFEPQYSRKVVADTLDNILDSVGVSCVDYIKIDVEGTEDKVLYGFTRYKSGTCFCIDYHLNLDAVLLTLASKVKIHGVTLWGIHTGFGCLEGSFI